MIKTTQRVRLISSHKRIIRINEERMRIELIPARENEMLDATQLLPSSLIAPHYLVTEFDCVMNKRLDSTFGLYLPQDVPVRFGEREFKLIHSIK